MWNFKAEIFKTENVVEDLTMFCMNYDTTCEAACSGETGIFLYYANFTEGNGETASTTSCSATTSHPVYTDTTMVEINSGTKIYNDAGLTSEFAGASKWYGIGANLNGPSNGKFQVDNTGVLGVKQMCPDYCCGDMTFYPSNFTGEDLNYGYEDCATGAMQYVTVYYGSSPVTVYGRLPCGISSFDMTVIKATGAELCSENTVSQTLYSYAPLGIGVYLYEDSGLVYTFQHGHTFIKEVSTTKIWELNTGGKIIAEYTSC